MTCISWAPLMADFCVSEASGRGQVEPGVGEERELEVLSPSTPSLHLWPPSTMTGPGRGPLFFGSSSHWALVTPFH